jgi:hypothetical protein
MNLSITPPPSAHHPRGLGEPPVEQIDDLLRPEPLREAGAGADVAEQHGNRLPPRLGVLQFAVRNLLHQVLGELALVQQPGKSRGIDRANPRLHLRDGSFGPQLDKQAERLRHGHDRLVAPLPVAATAVKVPESACRA